MLDTPSCGVDTALRRANEIARRLDQAPRLRDDVVAIWLDRHMVRKQLHHKCPSDAHKHEKRTQRG